MVCITGMIQRVFWITLLAAVPASQVAMASIRFPRLASAQKSFAAQRRHSLHSYGYARSPVSIHQLKAPATRRVVSAGAPLDPGGYPRKRRSLNTDHNADSAG